MTTLASSHKENRNEAVLITFENHVRYDIVLGRVLLRVYVYVRGKEMISSAQPSILSISFAREYIRGKKSKAYYCPTNRPITHNVTTTT